MGNLLGSLVAWGGKAIYLMPEETRVDLPASGGDLGFGLSIPVSPSPYALEFSIHGVSHERETFLHVFVGKQFFDGFYPVARWVPERFPPLTELVRT